MGASKKHSGLRTPLEEEDRKIRMFRIVTDLTLQRLCVERLTLPEARGVVTELRQVSENLFPGKGRVFDLVIAPRLERVIAERFFYRN